MTEPKEPMVDKYEQWAMFIVGIAFVTVGTIFGINDRNAEAIGCFLAGNYLAARLWLTKGFIR